MSTNRNRPIQGYDELGRLMGGAPEAAIFRRFGALVAEDLLYRQAELIELEKALRECQQDDKDSGQEDRERYALDWDLLQKSADDDAKDGNDGSQWETMLEIRRKLEDYQEALLRYRKVLDLGQPRKKQVKYLDKWMQNPTRGNVYLIGSDRKVWSEPDLDDMVALEPSPADGVRSELTLSLVHLYNTILGRHIHKEEKKDYLKNTIRYRNEGTFRVVRVLTTIIACLLPIVGIVGLYNVEHMSTRLGMIAIFTAVFSFSLNITTSASMRDIFAATAAFAAVLVVFVGTNGINDCSCNAKVA